MKSLKKLLSLILALSLLFTLVACGDSHSFNNDNDNDDDDDHSHQSETPTDVVIKEEPKGEYHFVIATDTMFKPFEYTDANGNFVGIDVDLLAAIAEDQGFEYELKALGWDASIGACMMGQADAMVAGASITEERKNSGWIFSDGYYTCTYALTVRKESGITGFSQLQGKTVGVQFGTEEEAYLKSLQSIYGFSIKYYDSHYNLYQAVLNGEVGGCVADNAMMKAEIKEGNLPLTVLENTANEGTQYGAAIFDSKNQEFLDMFNQGLKNIKANGKYDEILAKYLG